MTTGRRIVVYLGPKSGPFDPRWRWSVMDGGDTLALSPGAYLTVEDAQRAAGRLDLRVPIEVRGQPTPGVGPHTDDRE